MRAPLRAGETFERYEIESIIGRGGMGEVYRATDTRLRRKVALKVLRADSDERRGATRGGHGSPGSAAGDDAVARLYREARAAAALSHPNSVAIFDVGEADGTFYIVMELVTGAPLLAYVGDARVPLARKVGWMIDVARALAAAHAIGVIHRDVKPSNVMVAEGGVVKVLDFGLAKPLDPVSFRTAQGRILGTPRYMAPELFGEREADPRSDQYAFGVTAYELFAGKHPGSALDPPPAPLVDATPGIAPALSSIVMRTIEREASARFKSMDDVVTALADVVAGKPLRVSMPGAASEVPSTESLPGAASAADTLRDERLPPTLGASGADVPREERAKVAPTVGGSTRPMPIRAGSSGPPPSRSFEERKAALERAHGAMQTLLSREAPTGIRRLPAPLPIPTRTEEPALALTPKAPPLPRAEPARAEPSARSPKGLFVFVGIAALALGGGAFAGAYIATQRMSTPPPLPPPATTIPTAPASASAPSASVSAAEPEISAAPPLEPPICAAARSARARGSPMAARLEQQCVAAGGAPPPAATVRPSPTPTPTPVPTMR